MYKIQTVSFTGVHKDFASLQQQHGFEPSFQFAINISQWNFQKEKQTINY